MANYSRSDPWHWMSNSYQHESYGWPIAPASQVPLDFAQTLQSGILATGDQPPRERHQSICDLCRGITVEKLAQPSGYLYVRDMNAFCSADRTRHSCILCRAFSHQLSKVVEARKTDRKAAKLVWPAPLKCRLINLGTRNSKLILSNYILDCLEYKQDIEFEIYTDEGKNLYDFSITEQTLTIWLQVTQPRNLG